MCGIAGLWDRQGRLPSVAELAQRAQAMAAALAHRGPDDQGVWVDEAAGLALAHRRLAVIDLSPAGHQPMHSASGRWVVVFNGEVYNFRALRQELLELGHRFAGGSDTEVMLAAFEQWGLPAALTRFVGMFAFAAWDGGEQQLWLARDRLGKKPLYWGEVAGQMAFASELKAFCALPDFPRRLERAILPHYLQFGYCSPPHSAFAGVHALRPGSWLCLGRGGEISSGRYWSIAAAIQEGLAKPFPGGEAQAMEAFEEVLRDAVHLRMVADVPLGAFLSGGLDSSAVTALMQCSSPRPVRTFTVGFCEAAYDESRFAAAVARQLGCEHTPLTVTHRDALEVIPRLPELYDEPFADSSQIPTYLVAREARRHVTVALTGDGGDELLGGYTRYGVIADALARYDRLPRGLRGPAAQLLRTVTEDNHPWWLYGLAPLLGVRGRRLGSLRERVRRRALLLEALDWGAFYDRHGSACLNPEPALWLAVPGEGSARTWARECLAPLEPVAAMMALDFDQYLPDDILVKVDRASMAVALETRCPLLDHRVVEFAWRLPLSLKWDGRQGKLLLRRLLARYLPPALWDRPKMGFGIPVGEWLLDELRDWAEDLLDASRLPEAGVWRVPELRRAWREHLTGAYDHRNLLWPVLMFEAWRRHWRVV
mgnify:CR=1 FL=1